MYGGPAMAPGYGAAPCMYGGPAMTPGYGSTPFGRPMIPPPQLYGMHHGPDIVKPGVELPQPRRLNLVAMVISMLVPWLLFCVTFANSSFEMRYDKQGTCTVLTVAGILVVILLGALAVRAWMNQRAGDFTYEPTWHIFLFLTATMWLVIAHLAANSNYWGNMQPYYDYTHLGRYVFVNPSSMRGQELMDGGRVFFTNNTHLDESKAISFKNDHIYCVAPITAGTAPLSSYDFWAVGKDCCSEDAGTFQCGSSPTARSGLRAVSDSDRPFYRLAVQQAHGAFNIQSIHPLFFHWVDDADIAMMEYRARGYQAFMVGMIACFVVQLLLVYAAARLFSATEKFYGPPIL
mmetsp:Transcript_51471/g.95211  ORF Transcript_51471/g.95211 Transcript_51471/m.95211 type:complete len:347 (+) Transcript_51471:79-1119(+)